MSVSSQVAEARSADAVPVRRVWSEILGTWVERHRLVLGIILLVGYLAAFNGQWQIEPDSALYLSLGRNVALGRGYTYHGQPHDLVYPGFPYALAGLFKLFDMYRALYAADVMMVVIGLVTLGLTYRLVLLYSDRRTAVVVTLGVGISRLFARYCYEIMTDMPFLMGTMAFLAGYEAIFAARMAGRGKGRWYDWGLLGGGLLIAVTTRPTMIALVAIALGVMFHAAYKRRLPRGWALACAGVVGAAVVGFLFMDPRRSGGAASAPQSYELWVFDSLTHHWAEQLGVVWSNLRDGFFFTMTKSMLGMPGGAGWINVALGIPVVIAGIAMIRRRAIWGLWIGVTLIMLLLFTPIDRYVLQIFPLMVLAIWEGLCWVNRKMPRPWGNYCFGGLVFCIVTVNLIQFVTIVVLQHQHPFLDTYKEGRFRGYVATARQIHKFASREDLVLCPEKYARVLTFLSDRPVVEEDESADLKLEGHSLLVVNDLADGDLQQWLASEHVRLVGEPLFTVMRFGKEVRPPLMLWRAKVESVTSGPGKTGE